MSAIGKKKPQSTPPQDEAEKRGAAKVRAELDKARKDREAQKDAEWDRLFESSHDALAKLTAKARKEYREGRTEELDPDNL